MKNDTKTVADLRINEKGIIHSFQDEELSLQLMEMGCLPGTEVTMKHIAPLGDPICIYVSGYKLSLRVKEASTILIDPVE